MSYIKIPNSSTPSSTSISTPHSPPQPTEWDRLRKQARLLESQIDAKIPIYSKSNHHNHTLELEIGDLLNKLNSTINNMQQYADNSPSSSTSMMHMIQRHRDIHSDNSKDFRKTQTRLQLHYSAPTSLSTPPLDLESGYLNDMLLTERNRLDASMSNADSVLKAAFETRDELDRQRREVFESRNRTRGISQRFPQINKIISKIGIRKQRDAFIIGCVISACICFLLWYSLRGR